MASTAFDTHAASYDEVADSALGVALRARVHQILHGLTAPGDTVLDVGCGTGIDSEWLAPQVRSVTAIDASAEMVAHTRQRCRHLDNVTVHQVDLADETQRIPADVDSVDVVLANFGVVNCVGDLSVFGQRLQAIITPGGCAVIVTMARWCPLEITKGIATANRALLTRRRTGTTDDPAYTGLTLRYASARDLAAAFGSSFELIHAESLGSVLPPFEQRHWVETRPRVLGALAEIDRRVASIAARAGVGDHHLAVLKRLP